MLMGNINPITLQNIKLTSKAINLSNYTMTYWHVWD